MASNFLSMRGVVTLTLVMFLASCRAARKNSVSADSTSSLGQTRHAFPAHSPELARRADSLAKLDPESEARRAIARGDLRFIGVCGYVCVPVGIPLDSATGSRDSLATSTDSLHLIDGTSDNIANDDVARLNEVAARYARRYNRIIWARRAKPPASRPAI